MKLVVAVLIGPLAIILHQTQTCAQPVAIDGTHELLDGGSIAREKRMTEQGQTPLQPRTNARRSRTTLAAVPFTIEYLDKSRMVFAAHQILFGPLSEYYRRDTNNAAPAEDLSTILNQFRNNFTQYFNRNTAPRNLRDQFHQMYHQRNEVCHQSYAVECFDLDKKVLIEVATYLAQANVSNPSALLQTVANALNYRGTSTAANGTINCSRYETDSPTRSRSMSPRPSSSRSRSPSSNRNTQPVG